MALRVSGAGIAYVSQILLARWMGTFEFGIFVYAWVWATILSVLALIGFGGSIVRFGSEYVAKKEWRRAAGVVRRSLGIVLVTGITVAGGGAIVVGVAGDSIAHYYVAALLIAFGAVPLLALLYMVGHLARVFGWIGLAFAPLYVVRPLFLLAAIGVVMASGWRVTGTTVVALGLLSCVVMLAVQATIVARRLPLPLREARPIYETRLWLRVSIPLFLYNSFYLVIVSTDVIMLGLFLKPDQVAIYNAALRTAAIVTFIHLAVSAVVAPRFAALHAQGKHDELRALVANTTKWSLASSLFVSIVLLAVGHTVLGLFGTAFVAGYAALVVLVAGNCLHTSMGPFGDLLTMSGNQNQAAVALGCGAVMNIALNGALIPAFGIIGAATATAASMMLITITLVWLAKRRLDILPFVFARS